MTRTRTAAILLAVALAATVALFPGASEAKKGRGKNKGKAGAQAVVGVIDTGINPYHVTFRDDSPLGRAHPSTYIPGFPKNAPALRLSLNEADYWTAVRKDCDVWNKVKPGKLYWIPGTKIVGAISFETQSLLNCAEAEPTAAGRILDNDGHGTMTASRATSFEYGACKDCRVVAIQFAANGFADDAIPSITWAADNADWIDAQSNSWGPVAPLWEPTGASQIMAANPQLARAVEEVSQAHLAFWASGNGAAFRYGVLGHPTLLAPHLGPSAIIVGGHDSGYVTAWTGFPPHIVSDACASWAAKVFATDESADDLGSGTSAATPFAAGGSARILLEARRILGDGGTGVHKGIVAKGPKGIVKKGPLADGKLTLEEWKRLTYVSASPRPKAQYEDGPPCGVLGGLGLYTEVPVMWKDVPEGYPEYLHIGYGAVDDQAQKLALQILKGKKEAPDRSATDTYFEQDHTIRETTHEVFTTP